MVLDADSRGQTGRDRHPPRPAGDPVRRTRGRASTASAVGVPCGASSRQTKYRGRGRRDSRQNNFFGWNQVPVVLADSEPVGPHRQHQTYREAAMKQGIADLNARATVCRIVEES